MICLLINLIKIYGQRNVDIFFLIIFIVEKALSIVLVVNILFCLGMTKQCLQIMIRLVDVVHYVTMDFLLV